MRDQFTVNDRCYNCIHWNKSSKVRTKIDGTMFDDMAVCNIDEETKFADHVCSIGAFKKVKE